LDVVWLCVQLLPGVFSHTKGPGLRKTRATLKKWPGVHHREKTPWDWKVPQQRLPRLCWQLFHVCSTCPLSTYITGTVRRNRKVLSQQFKNKSAVGKKIYCRSSPPLACVFCEKKS
jgi:hypothetical protein